MKKQLTESKTTQNTGWFDMPDLAIVALIQACV